MNFMHSLTSGGQNLCSERAEPQKTAKVLELVLREAATEITTIFQVIKMASLHIGAVPQAWRSTNQGAFHKKGDPLVNSANYLPVSLTSICF